MQRRGTVLLALLITILGSALTPPLEAQGNDRAEAAAVGFLRSLEQSDLRSIYRERASSSLKQNVTEEAFVAQLSILRGQLGGQGSGRQLIDARALDQLPNTPLRGTFYFLRHKTRYPVGNAYEDVYLESEGGNWKVVAWWFYPAPQ